MSGCQLVIRAVLPTTTELFLNGFHGFPFLFVRRFPLLHDLDSAFSFKHLFLGATWTASSLWLLGGRHGPGLVCTVLKVEWKYFQLGQKVFAGFSQIISTENKNPFHSKKNM